MKIIKKEVIIDAPASKVLRHITDPEKLAGWLMPNDFEAVIGRPFSIDCSQQGKISCVVKEIIPEKKLVYSFQSAATKIETLVTFLLTPEGSGTRVTIIHSGWDALPPSDQGTADTFGEGWGQFLEKLRKGLAEA